MQTMPHCSLLLQCKACGTSFGFVFVRRHHCRMCGGSFCAACSANLGAIPHMGFLEPVSNSATHSASHSATCSPTCSPTLPFALPVTLSLALQLSVNLSSICSASDFVTRSTWQLLLSLTPPLALVILFLPHTVPVSERHSVIDL